jgi:hypothetical protein
MERPIVDEGHRLKGGARSCASGSDALEEGMSPVQRMQARFSLPTVLVGVLAVVLANLPLWLAAVQDDMRRGIFSLDGIIAVAVGFRSRRWGAFLLIGAWLLDLAVAKSITYHFPSPALFVASAKFGGALDLRSLLDPFDIAIFLALAGSFVALLRLQRQKPPTRTLAAIFIIVGTLDVLNGSSAMSMKEFRSLDVNVAGSPALVMLSSVLHNPTEALPLASIKGPNAVGSYLKVRDWMTTHPDGSVFVVVVESLGLPVDPHQRAWLSSRMRPKGAQAVDEESVEFSGPTTYGELRTLCLLVGGYDRLKSESATTCLPRLAADKGWKTSGYHGFTERMFDRAIWWPTIGVQNMYFLEQLKAAGATQRCGAAFAGICDAELLRRAASSISPRSLVYVLTLNTHLPLASTEVSADLAPLCQDAPRSACELLSATGRVLDEVRQVADEHPNSLVLVVGDHAPPFKNKAARQAFSPNRVPAWIVYPAVR